MHTVEQATVIGADLDRHTNKAAVAAIAMPLLADGSRFVVIIHSSSVTRYNITDLVADHCSN